MKLHILTNPNKKTTLLDRTEPFSTITHKYIKNLHTKYEMIHYGLSGSDVACRHIDMPEGCEEYNKAAAIAIQENKEPGDIILCFYGYDNSIAANHNSDLKIVEPIIGYRTAGIFAPYRVFVSYALMHVYYGEKGMLMNPSWFDAVIPNPFDPSEFEFNHNKEDYMIYLGRVVQEKGVDVAIQATEKAGIKLYIAGPDRAGNSSLDLRHMGYTSVPDHVTVLGTLGVEERKHYLSRAKALLAPTYYLEPFGNIIAEAHLSGTPTITTDWGAFPENNIEGVTGFRCKEMREFVAAIKNIDMIDPTVCYNHALQNYSEEVVFKQHDAYLQKVIASSFYR